MGLTAFLLIPCCTTGGGYIFMTGQTSPINCLLPNLPGYELLLIRRLMNLTARVFYMIIPGLLFLLNMILTLGLFLKREWYMSGRALEKFLMQKGIPSLLIMRRPGNHSWSNTMEIIRSCLAKMTYLLTYKPGGRIT